MCEQNYVYIDKIPCTHYAYTYRQAWGTYERCTYTQMCFGFLLPRIARPPSVVCPCIHPFPMCSKEERERERGWIFWAHFEAQIGPNFILKSHSGKRQVFQPFLKILANVYLPPVDDFPVAILE